jgi:PAS domain S-box-containing protein
MHVMDRDFRIVLFNQSFRDWVESLGLEAAIEGRTVFEAFPFLPEQVRDEYRRVFEAGTTLITEETTRVGARDIITETRKIPVFEGERVARIITVVRDITDRRRMEQQLLKTQKLESIGLLAGGIAHDFNNLLAGVLTNLAVARAKASGDSSLGRALAEAERAAYRARGLTQRLLAFSGGSEPIRRPLALGPLVRETVEFALAGSDVRSSLAVPDNLWPVHADAQQIGQVLQNLVLNARQAMPDGGTVAIVAENVLVGPGGPLQLAPGRFVRISVVDHGVGIPAEHVPRIFDPFFTTKEGGGGLGLASSFATVKKHGGAIEFQSQPGVGTTFHVYLPASNAPAAPPPGPSGEPGRPAARILLMEDDTILRRGARRLLRQSGYEVECARDGAEAVALYGQAMQAGHPFDAVILDLVVSEGMGGEECARGLRALDPGVKAIACTGYAEDDVFACLREQGFRAFLRKPFTPEELAEALRRVAAADA